MVIFISGSINSGKTTTAKALAQKLGAEFIDIDDLNDRIPNFDLSKDIPKGIEIAIDEISKLTTQGKSVVLSYVIRREDHEQIIKGLKNSNPKFITLSPRIHIAQSNRGDRELTEWEKQRVQHHYHTGIATPQFGKVIDNSEMTVEEVVDSIIDTISP